MHYNYNTVVLDLMTASWREIQLKWESGLNYVMDFMMVHMSLKLVNIRMGKDLENGIFGIRRINVIVKTY